MMSDQYTGASQDVADREERLKELMTTDLVVVDYFQGSEWSTGRELPTVRIDAIQRHHLEGICESIRTLSLGMASEIRMNELGFVGFSGSINEFTFKLVEGRPSFALDAKSKKGTFFQNRLDWEATFDLLQGLLASGSGHQYLYNNRWTIVVCFREKSRYSKFRPTT